MPELANPTIALGVQNTGANPLGNPFEIIGQVANAQRSLAEAQNTRQTLAAKQRAGQIISQSPDLDTAVQNMMKDPQTSAFVPDIMSTLQGISSTIQSQKATQQSISASQTSQAGEQQNQALNGFQSLMKVIGTSGPDSVRANTDAVMSTLSPTAQAANKKSIDAVLTGLTAGLDDPNMPLEQKQKTYAKRQAAIAIGAGVGPDDVRALNGAVAPTMQVLPGMGEGGSDIIGTVGSPDLVSKPTVQIPGRTAGGPVQSLTPDQKGALTALGAQEGDTAKQMSDAAAGAPAQLRNISLIQDALKVVNTGGGASNRSALASTAQMFKQAGFPITDAAISELANGKDGQVDGLPASQLISNELRAVALTNLKTAQESLGRASAPELNATIESLSNNMDPKLLQTVVDKMAYSIQMQKDRSDHYTTDYYKARQSGEVGPDSFNEYYNHNFLDGFNAKFEKEHPRVIGTPLPAAPKDAAAEKKSKLESIWGQ